MLALHPREQEGFGDLLATSLGGCCHPWTRLGRPGEGGLVASSDVLDSWVKLRPSSAPAPDAAGIPASLKNLPQPYSSEEKVEKRLQKGSSKSSVPSDLCRSWEPTSHLPQPSGLFKSPSWQTAPSSCPRPIPDACDCVCLSARSLLFLS